MQSYNLLIILIINKPSRRGNKFRKVIRKVMEDDYFPQERTKLKDWLGYLECKGIFILEVIQSFFFLPLEKNDLQS